MATGQWWNQKAKLYPEVSSYRSSRGSPLEIRDGQLLNDFDSTQHSTTGVSMPELLFGRRIRTKLPISKSSASKMRCEIMTVREKKKGRCMQTAKGMHVKAKLKKVIRCYWDWIKKTNCQVTIQTARQMEFSLPLSIVLVYLNYMSLRIECSNDCCNTCMCIHVITLTSDRPETQHQGLRGHILCILVCTTRAFQECGQIRENSRYAVHRVSLTKNRLWAPLVACNSGMRK